MILRIPYNYFLIKRFPFLKVVNYWYDKEESKYDYRFTWLDYMEPGWRKAFGIQMCKDIKKVLKKSTQDDLHTYSVIEVKEKYGALRWYDGGYSQEISEEMGTLLFKYENLSEVICFRCGKPATKISKGWICPWCDRCAKKAQSTQPGMKFDDIDE